MLYRKIYFIPIYLYLYLDLYTYTLFFYSFCKQCVNKLVNGNENVIECKII